VRVHPAHVPALLLRWYFGEEKWERAYKFGVKRNPYDRVVSWYYYENNCTQSIDRHICEFRRWMLKRNGETVESLLADRPTDLWQLWSDGEKLIIDEVFDYYELVKVWPEICMKTVGELRKLKHTNKARGRDRDWRIYYDTPSFDIVTRMFKNDLSNFGYTFNPEGMKCW
jgi:hypothetical protein